MWHRASKQIDRQLKQGEHGQHYHSIPALSIFTCFHVFKFAVFFLNPEFD